MSKLIWDKTGERYYETGLDRGVLYPMQDTGFYTKGVAWNGLTSATEKPSGGEPNPIWADNIKYANMMSAEEFGLTIEAFTFPDEFAECDGSKEVAPGIVIGQQDRKTFGLSYRTKFGNDAKGNDLGYKLHLVYGCLASPSEKGYTTLNDSPDAVSFSWDIDCTPVNVTDYKPTSSITITSTKMDAEKLAALEEVLYGKDPSTPDGTDGVDPRLPLPDEVFSVFGVTAGV